jgi:hypothetical protein
MNKQRTAKELSPHHYLKLLGRVFSERLTKFSDAFLLLNEKCTYLTKDGIFFTFINDRFNPGHIERL